jgi:hypothetical protein
LKLLKQWQDAGRFGLTVPFLFGALDRWPGHPLGEERSSSQKLLSMLSSLRDDAPQGVIIRLFMCGTVKDLTVAPVFGMPGYCRAVPSSNGERTAFYVQQDLIPESQSPLEALHAALWQRYEDALANGRFSLRDGKFVEFTEADLRHIEAAVSRPDDDDA